jgi:TolA-binding protein
MQKTLKTFVVLNLILAGVALWKGIEIFQQREIIKSRVQSHEEAVLKAAKDLKLDAAELAKLNADIKNVERLPALLSGFNKLALERQVDLEQTRANLENTKQELARTVDELNSTKISLDNARAEIASLNNDLSRTKEELATSQGQVEQLRGEIGGLRGQIAELNDTIAKKDQEFQALQNDYAVLEKEKSLLEREIAARSGDSVDEILIGKTARVIWVNSDWNFVIVDKGRDDLFVPNLKAIVNRDGTYIGTLTMTDVKDKITVADINAGDLIEGAKIQVGDVMFFPPRVD